MDLKVGDKLLCRKTFYNEKGEHIFQIGKYYDIIGEIIYMSTMKYHITSEQKFIGLNLTQNAIGYYFLVDKKKIRKFKLNKIKKLNGR